MRGGRPGPYRTASPPSESPAADISLELPVFSQDQRQRPERRCGEGARSALRPAPPGARGHGHSFSTLAVEGAFISGYAICLSSQKLIESSLRLTGTPIPFSFKSPHTSFSPPPCPMRPRPARPCQRLLVGSETSGQGRASSMPSTQPPCARAQRTSSSARSASPAATSNPAETGSGLSLRG